MNKCTAKTKKITMEKHPTIFLHIGVHKTASSFLQESFFLSLNSYRYSNQGFFYLEQDNDFYNKLLSTLSLPPTHLKQNPEIITELNQLLQSQLPESCEKVLISQEGITGSIYNSYKDMFDRATNLNLIFPGANIIIFLRNQADFLESLYQQVVKEGYSIRPLKFLGIKKVSGNYAILKSPDNFPHFFADEADWNNLVGLYEELFGENNVQLFPYTIIFKDPEKLTKKLEQTFGLKAVKLLHTKRKKNPSLSFISFWLCFLLNPLRQLDHNAIGFWPPAKPYKKIKNPFYRNLVKLLNCFCIPNCFLRLDELLGLKKYKVFSNGLKCFINSLYIRPNQEIDKKINTSLKDI